MLAADGLCCWPHMLAEQAGGQRLGIAIEQYGIRSNMLAVSKNGTTGTAVAHDNFAAGNTVSKLHPFALSQTCQCSGQRMHAALHGPNTVKLDLRYQHQGRWRGPG